MSGQLILFQKSLQPRHGYSSRRIKMELAGLHQVISTYLYVECVSQSFYPGDLRSGQFRDIFILSIWGNMKMFPASHKLTETTQFFQDHDHWGESNYNVIF